MHVSRGEAATALAGGVAAVAGSFAVAGRTPAFVVAPVAGLVVDRTPGVVVTAAIRLLGDWGHRLALAVAVLLAVVLFAGIGLLAVRVGRRSDVPYTSVAVATLAGGSSRSRRRASRSSPWPRRGRWRRWSRSPSARGASAA